MAMNLVLKKPNIECKERVLSFKKEFIDNKEELRGTAFLETTDVFEDWLEILKQNFDEETVKEGFVPASTYMVLNEEGDKKEIIGMLDVRHRLNEQIEKYSGHISYSIAQKYRNNGYGTEMLRQALEICEVYGITDVLVTCDKNNPAGIRTIEKNNGKFENEVDRGDKIINRYWIDTTIDPTLLDD